MAKNGLTTEQTDKVQELMVELRDLHRKCSNQLSRMQSIMNEIDYTIEVRFQLPPEEIDRINAALKGDGYKKYLKQEQS